MSRSWPKIGVRELPTKCSNEPPIGERGKAKNELEADKKLDLQWEETGGMLLVRRQIENNLITSCIARCAVPKSKVLRTK